MVGKSIKLSLLFALCLTLAALVQPTVAKAQATTVLKINTTVPEDFSFFSPCHGEELLVNGSFHLLTHILVDSAGGIHAHLTANDSALTILGLTTGTIYRRVGADVIQTNEQIDGFPFTSTFVRAFNIIGPGPRNNLLIHRTMHITINDNGEVTADFDFVSVECR